MSLILQLVSVTIAGLCAVSAAIAVITLLKHRTDTLGKVEEQVQKDVKELSKSVVDLLVLVKTAAAEQAVINQMTTKTLESLLKRIERLERQENHRRESEQ